ncbi:hypothetical protein ONZ45_g13993 [Pleurotus djamor]|nr:hypothetical protein ONZ45_g13993 [Pleurotus djamor]
MTEFASSDAALPHIPDHLSIPQFMLEYQHPDPDISWAIQIKSRPNDVVCIFSPNHTDYPIAIWAAHTLGAVITPANPAYTVDELVYQLHTTKASLILVHPDFLQTVLEAAKRVHLNESRIVLFNKPEASISYDGVLNLDDLVSFGASRSKTYTEKKFTEGEAKRRLAFLSFSSGTTGKPKAVSISHYSVIANIIQMAVHFRINSPDATSRSITPGDIAIAVLPFFHIYGLVVNMHFSLFSGMSIVVIPKFNFTSFLRSIIDHKITHLLLVPPQIVLLCKHPAVKGLDFSHVKFCLSGAAPLSGELVKQVVGLFPNARVGQGYGLTETCTTIALVPPEQKIGTIGSAGKLIPGLKARVLKPDGSMAGVGEVGELVVSGPSMSLGYANNPQATKETFVNGWVRTGDEVMINENCEVFVLDRVKEIFKVRGFQVAPAELEGHLLMHHHVADACVVSILDEYSGELPLAYVVLDPSVEHLARDPKAANKLKAEIAKHVSDTKVQYKWLAGGVEFIDAIPKNPSGKILRRVLRDKARKERAHAPLQAKL